VKGNLSAISSLIANSAILFEALAETILANGERPGRIHPRLRAQAITAGAIIGRKPATAPMPIANAGACWRFIRDVNVLHCADYLGKSNNRTRAAPWGQSSVSLDYFGILDGLTKHGIAHYHPEELAALSTVFSAPPKAAEIRDSGTLVARVVEGLFRGITSGVARYTRRDRDRFSKPTSRY
jgi:hypothetical protein